MTQVIVLAFAVLLIAGGVMARRADLSRRRGLARTLELLVDGEGVERRLADGRTERARWDALETVEVVCTPVATADGAKAFLVLSESLAEGDERGCLVPLGVGKETQVIEALGSLAGFRLERFNEAVELRPPRRTIIWERS